MASNIIKKFMLKNLYLDNIELNNNNNNIYI